MTKITLNGDALQYISVFERVTRTRVVDCIETPDKLIFIVAPGQIRLAVGKKGENKAFLRALEEILGRETK